MDTILDAKRSFIKKSFFATLKTLLLLRLINLSRSENSKIRRRKRLNDPF